VIIGVDSHGVQYVTAKRETMSLSCRARVRLRGMWRRWKGSVFALGIFFTCAYYTRSRLLARQIENAKVAGLVQTALDGLRSQELAHHTDPITARHPYLSSLQLRDYVLQDEHSVPARTRLWAKVEKVVEGNTNVRANLEETEAGDELRVWRWVGHATPVRENRRVTFQGK